eukprot:1649562-Alexandrium_andersonii.AAC.1
MRWTPNSPTGCQDAHLALDLRRRARQCQASDGPATAAGSATKGSHVMQCYGSLNQGRGDHEGRVGQGRASNF